MSKKLTLKLLLAVILLAVVVTTGIVYYLVMQPEDNQQTTLPIVSTDEADNYESLDDTVEKIAEPTTTSKIAHSFPIHNAQSRITKKPFGIKIDPATSPVQPEKFSGYHTGTDFEVTEEEINQEIKVSAICDGKIVQKRRVSGYGGVIIQECSLNDERVSVLYGHLSLSKNIVRTGDQLVAGDELAILADNKSDDAGDERKHLHLGIYKGSQADLRGYVNTKRELENWIDVADVLNLK